MIVLIEAILAYITSPVVSNQLAMTQMENSNEIYFFVNAIVNARSTINTIGNIGSLALSVSIGLDIRKFATSVFNRKNNKKEN